MLPDTVNLGHPWINFNFFVTFALSSSSIFQSFRKMRIDVGIGLDCSRMFVSFAE